MPMRYEAVFTVHAPGDGVERRLDHGQAEIEPLVERNCLVRLQGGALEWLAFTLIWLGLISRLMSRRCWLAV